MSIINKIIEYDNIHDSIKENKRKVKKRGS